MNQTALTNAQRAQWDQDGYLLLPQVLSKQEVGALLETSHSVFASAQVAGELHSQAPAAAMAAGGNAGALKAIRAIDQTPAFDFLLDHPKTFGTLVALLGPFLQVLGTEIFFRPPSEDGQLLVEWHTDGGPSMYSLVCHPGEVPLQIKIQFFLTDLSSPDQGNFMLLPGSHQTRFPATGIALGTHPNGAIQLLANAGDAVVFPWSLWHAVGPNTASQARRSIALRYGPLWARPYDYWQIAPETRERLTPRRRRLLGDMGPSCRPFDYYYPDEESQLRLMRGDM